MSVLLAVLAGAVVGHAPFGWWQATGGPSVYYLGTRTPVPGVVYIDDSAPCGPGEAFPMNTISAPRGSVPCERLWVGYWRSRASVVWAAAAGAVRFRGADVTLREWYPAYGAPRTVACGWRGYIVQRYLTGSPFAGFGRLWRSAQRCRPLVLGWL
jgi:hypothetical protein